MTRSPFRDSCAFCGSRAFEGIIDFGDVALAGAFVATEPRYRLRVFFCTRCCAPQVPDVVDPTELFANFFSKIRSLREQFLDYASKVVAPFLKPEKATVVEIGCNDGVLLKRCHAGIAQLLDKDGVFVFEVHTWEACCADCSTT